MTFPTICTSKCIHNKCWLMLWLLSSGRCAVVCSVHIFSSAASNGVSSSPSPPTITHPYNARLCHVRTWPNWPGFGFNMHSQKGKPGQFIGSVDAGSPADLAGLKEGDRILAVNGTSVKGFEHPQVVGLIKTDPTSNKLLLVDKEADDYFTSKGIDIKPEDDFVVHKANPETQPLGEWRPWPLTPPDPSRPFLPSARVGFFC